MTQRETLKDVAKARLKNRPPSHWPNYMETSVRVIAAQFKIKLAAATYRKIAEEIARELGRDARNRQPDSNRRKKAS